MKRGREGERVQFGTFEVSYSESGKALSTFKPAASLAAHAQSRPARCRVGFERVAMTRNCAILNSFVIGLTESIHQLSTPESLTLYLQTTTKRFRPVLVNFVSVLLLSTSY